MTVEVPATSANLGPGFDSLGLALSWYDTVRMRIAATGLSVHVTGSGAQSVPRDASHLVVRAAHAAFEVLGGAPPGLTLSCTNVLPHGRGLGSSAAAIVAGIVAARALVDRGVEQLDDAAALRLAARLEGHPDNVAAALLGGLTIAWDDGDGAQATRLDATGDVVAFVPPHSVPTQVARGLLPTSVPHEDAARNAGRAALLVTALAGRPQLLLPATRDWLHQAYRAPAMPHSLELVSVLRAAGVAGVVSGAGPTVLAFAAGTSLQQVAALAPPGWTAHALAISATGAHVRTS